MKARSHRQEIDHRTIKLMMGSIAIAFPILISALSRPGITSISASYFEGGWPQTIFIGFLFAIAAFLMAYNGLSKLEMYLSKLASIAALGVAWFPCACTAQPELIPHIHEVFASLMFLILAFFCYLFFKRAKAKGYFQAHARAAVYATCGALILLSIIVLGYNVLTHGSLAASIPRLIFYGEAVGLIAFGVAWLTASRVLPLLTLPNERFSPLKELNPD